MSVGYRVRRPETVPTAFRGFTEQWEMKDVIMVAGEHILMEIPEVHYTKMQRAKHTSNNEIMRDIQDSHGKITRVDGGEVQEFKDNRATKFFSETQVAREDNGSDIAFDE